MGRVSYQVLPQNFPRLLACGWGLPGHRPHLEGDSDAPSGPRCPVPGQWACFHAGDKALIKLLVPLGCCLRGLGVVVELRCWEGRVYLHRVPLLPFLTRGCSEYFVQTWLSPHLTAGQEVTVKPEGRGPWTLPSPSLPSLVTGSRTVPDVGPHKAAPGTGLRMARPSKGAVMLPKTGSECGPLEVAGPSPGCGKAQPI